MFKYQDVQKWMKHANTKVDTISKNQWYQHHNDYYLDVNVAALRCLYEVGPNFTWTLCANYADCSASTVRKYYDEYFRIPQWYLNQLLEDAIQNPSIGNTVIETYKHIDPATLPSCLQEAITFHSPNLYKSCPGVYLIAQTFFNIEKEEIWYFVKIGKGNKVSERLKDYNTCNPNYLIIDVQYCNENELTDLETKWQNKLNNFGMRMGDNKEWFVVSRATYLRIIKQGFKGI